MCWTDDRARRVRRQAAEHALDGLRAAGRRADGEHLVRRLEHRRGGRGRRGRVGRGPARADARRRGGAHARARSAATPWTASDDPGLAMTSTAPRASARTAGLAVPRRERAHHDHRSRHVAHELREEAQPVHARHLDVEGDDVAGGGGRSSRAPRTGPPRCRRPRCRGAGRARRPAPCARAPSRRRRGRGSRGPAGREERLGRLEHHARAAALDVEPRAPRRRAAPGGGPAGASKPLAGAARRNTASGPPAWESTCPHTTFANSPTASRHSAGPASAAPACSRRARPPRRRSPRRRARRGRGPAGRAREGRRARPRRRRLTGRRARRARRRGARATQKSSAPSSTAAAAAWGA
jgi:hypothetical protein